MKIKRIILLSSLIFFLFFPGQALAANSVPWWPVQSVDTMKFSRDLARARLSDAKFDQTIDFQIKAVAQTGATHAAIGTPYDEEFLPYLTRWVKAARAANLHIWFRGNFSGWEGWFDYPPISRQQHLEKLKSFIINHPDLFSDGDIFSSCPECENGGPGDPRQTGDVSGHRQFIIAQYQTAKDAFIRINKKVAANYFSMNADVARLIMDPETTKALDNLVVIDHYVSTPQKLIADIEEISRQSGGKVFLGEFGVPIPSINGSMTENEQAAWLDSALAGLEKTPRLSGLNYWTSFGGSTQLFNDDGSGRKAAAVVQKYFSPKIIFGRVTNQFGRPIRNTKIQDGIKITYTDEDGRFKLPVIFPAPELEISAQGYTSLAYQINENDNNLKITIDKTKPNILDYILGLIYRVFVKK